jgi:hypothetical protein
MKDSWLWLLIGGVVIYYLYTQQQQAGGSTPTVGLMQPTSYSIYPSMASMATTSNQQASTVVPPVSLYSATQATNTADILTQCAGSYPGCSPLLADTQLGL